MGGKWMLIRRPGGADEWADGPAWRRVPAGGDMPAPSFAPRVRWGAGLSSSAIRARGEYHRECEQQRVPTLHTNETRRPRRNSGPPRSFLTKLGTAPRPSKRIATTTFRTITTAWPIIQRSPRTTAPTPSTITPPIDATTPRKITASLSSRHHKRGQRPSGSTASRRSANRCSYGIATDFTTEDRECEQPRVPRMTISTDHDHREPRPRHHEHSVHPHARYEYSQTTTGDHKKGRRDEYSTSAVAKRHARGNIG